MQQPETGQPETGQADSLGEGAGDVPLAVGVLLEGERRCWCSRKGSFRGPVGEPRESNSAIYNTGCYTVSVRVGANIQDQSVHPFCRQGGHFGCRAVPGDSGRGERVDQRRSWGRCDQAADRTPRSGEVRRVSDADRIQAGIRAIFVHGFAKNEKDNIEQDELAALKKLANELLGYDDKTIARVIVSGVLVEVTCDEKTIS
jgi:hypothetical protein